jgi:ATP-binding cassette, subfamily B, bacterial HlyB/CyaB
LQQAAAPFTTEMFVWSMGCLCQLQRIPFDGQLLLQQFPTPHTMASFLTASKSLGLKLSFKTAAADQLSTYPLPLLVMMQPASSPAALNQSQKSTTSAASTLSTTSAASDAQNTTPTINFGLVLRADVDRVLYLDAGNSTPTMLGRAEFALRYGGQIVLSKAETPQITDPDQQGSSNGQGQAQGKAQAQREFGFRWFIPELLKHKTIWRDVLLASLTIQLIALATPLLTQVIIDKVVVHHTMQTLIVIGVALVVFALFSAGMTWVRQYLVLHTGNRVDAVLGTQVFSRLFMLPTRYYEHRSTGVVVARIHGVETIREFVSGAAVTLILDLPFLVIFLGIMFYYSVMLTLVSLAILSVIVILSILVAPIFRDKLNQQFLLGARNQAFLTEYVSGMETVKSLQLEPQITRTFGDYMAQYLQAGFLTKQWGNTYNVIANTLEQGMTLAILFLGAWLVMTTTDFTIGMLVAFQMFSGKLSQPLLRLVGLWQQFQQANIAVKRLGDVMNAPVEPYSLTPSREGNGKGMIEIKSLAFRYNEERPFLYQNLNLSIKPGQAIALMGPSGCGKSTLAKLLLGFYQPSEGQILIDGRDIRNLSANELRSHFGVVPQETMLFSGSIYHNLQLANPHASFEQIVEACKMAEVHEVIEQLPQGYQTEIGERGVGLSGGQKQRLAIARALLKKPKILIFDEATSNLDQQTAEHFAHTINALKGKVTMIFITHAMPKGLQIDDVFTFGNSQQQARDA